MGRPMVASSEVNFQAIRLLPTEWGQLRTLLPTNDKRSRLLIFGKWGNRAFAEKQCAGEPDLGIMVTIGNAHVAHAGLYPLFIRPPNEPNFPLGTPQDFLRDTISHSGNFRNLSDGHGRRKGENMDPLTRALHATGTIPAEPYSLRMLSAD